MKLFHVLNRLESRQIRRFGLYLKSDLYNKRSDIRTLFDSWIEGKKKTRNPSYFWKEVYGNKSFSSKEWNLLSSRMYKLLEQFLSHEELSQNETLQQFYLAKSFRKLKQENHFKIAIKETAKNLEKQAFRNTDYLQKQYDISFESYDYVISNNRNEKTNLQLVSDHLDIYFVAAKLRHACYALSREIIQQEKYDVKLLQEALAFVEDNPASLEIPAIAIYYYCYTAIYAGDNEEYFIKLRTAIQKYQDFFPPSEIRDIYTVAINFSIRKLNTGAEMFIREAYELYIMCLEKGYLLDDGILLESTFSNIVSLALKLGKYDQARQFISEYQKHLKPVYQVPLFHFSMGKMYYEQGKLRDSLQELIMVESKASFLLLGSRILQLKIYFELKEFDPLESLLESTRVYLQRSKDLAYRKKHYNNILSFTKQLLQLPVMSKEERAQLRARIEKAEIFSEKDWFLKQV